MLKTSRLLIAGAVGLIGASILTSDLQAEEPMAVRFCTGGENFPYDVAGNMVKNALGASPDVTIEVVNTKGTWDNVRRTAVLELDDPEHCDAMIGQPDGKSLLERQTPAAAGKLRKINKYHREYLHVLCGTESGVDSLDDLEDDPKAYNLVVGEDGSGGWLLWQNLTYEDEDYGEVPTRSESGALALSGLASGELTCMLVPAGIRNKTTMQADRDYAGQIKLVEAQDYDFNDATDADGEKLYDFDSIPSGVYTNSLQDGFFGGPSVDTIAWDAGVYIRTDAFAEKPKALEGFISAVSRARAEVLATFNPS